MSRPTVPPSPSLPELPSLPGDPHADAGAPPTPAAALWGDSDVPPPGFDAGLASPGASAADRDMPTIGHIGRYALKYKMGVGGLGTVYAAYDPLLSRLIAVKTLNVELDETEREAFNAVFINEARAAGGLSHPHIVTVFDAGISDKRAYIAMELLKGRDLRKLRQEGWRATPAQAALIVRRVADALAFAHSKGVVHRDVKPANIFMVGRTQPRVLDFGIARIAHQRDSADLHSGAGSPYYMAPEQIRREPADRRADVFSLGVVLYELLTDQRPFRGESLKDIVAAVLTHEPPLASKVDAGVPKDLAAIVARAMHKDPEQRFRSARSFARELRQWLDANPVGPDGEALPTTKPARPGRRWLVAGTAAGLVAAAGIIGWQALPIADFLGLAPAPMASVTSAPARSSATAIRLAPPAAAVATTLPLVPVVAAVPSAPVVQPAPTLLPTLAASAPVIASPPTAEAAASAVSTAIAVSLGLPALAPAPATTAPAQPAATAAATTTPLVPSVVAAPTYPTAKTRQAREAAERERRERAMRAAALAANLPLAPAADDKPR